MIGDTLKKQLRLKILILETFILTRQKKRQQFLPTSKLYSMYLIQIQFGYILQHMLGGLNTYHRGSGTSVYSSLIRFFQDFIELAVYFKTESNINNNNIEGFSKGVEQ